MSKTAIDEKWFWENDPILSRFSFEFYKKRMTNPMYYAVHMMIVNPNISEHQIIEELLKLNESLSNTIVKLQEEQKPKFFIRKENDE